jgi:small subunit ribosomal protein S16
MLRIRLSRHGRTHRPFFRIVLTEHTKPVKSGYQQVLGWYDPINHKQDLDIDAIKEWISKGAQPSERVAKLAYKVSGDEMFKKFFRIRERQRPKKKEQE